MGRRSPSFLGGGILHSVFPKGGRKEKRNLKAPREKGKKGEKKPFLNIVGKSRTLDLGRVKVRGGKKKEKNQNLDRISAGTEKREKEGGRKHLIYLPIRKRGWKGNLH